MANLALKHHYQTINSIVSGPLYRSMNFEENKIRLYFDYAEGLHFKGKSDTTFFEIAGKDRIFYPAKAEISENTILVSSRKVNKPLAVRFAWSNTAEPDLFNSAGLPASCFRTDNWEIKLNQK